MERKSKSLVANNLLQYALMFCSYKFIYTVPSEYSLKRNSVVEMGNTLSDHQQNMYRLL